MAKKKIRKKRTSKKTASAASVMTLLDEGPEVVEAVRAPAPVKVAEPPPLSKPTIGKCGVCDKADKEIAYADGDEHWEIPGHPDHIFRFVCVDCRGDYESRDKCAQAVYVSMREALQKKGLDGYAVESAISVAHRSFMVDFDSKSLIKMAKQLKVTHPWLKGKHSK